MLQQTQVKTVIPYWTRWMQEFPTLESLANASADKIHKLWEGLGYYTRVRNMQKAAQQIVAEQAGQFPQTFDAILALPGIGRYTAGAICSIAFNQPTPILDGNVIRVLTRIHGIKTDPREKQTNAQLWHLATELVTHASRIGLSAPRQGSRAQDEDDQTCSNLNQSLMELGALICTPRSPNCTACPMQKLCVARKENLQEQLPNLRKRATVIKRRFTAFVVERHGKFLVRQRPAGTLNAHLWEFPNVEVAATNGRASTSARADGRQMASREQSKAAIRQGGVFHPIAVNPICTIKHAITRNRITLTAYRARYTPGNPKPEDQWFTLPQLRGLAFTAAHKRILAHLSAQLTKPAG